MIQNVQTFQRSNAADPHLVDPPAVCLGCGSDLVANLVVHHNEEATHAYRTCRRCLATGASLAEANRRWAVKQKHPSP